jgi:hypothetical protein
MTDSKNILCHRSLDYFGALAYCSKEEAAAVVGVLA